MKSSMRDRVEGTLHDVKGQVTAVTGRMANKPAMVAKGNAEILAGKSQKTSARIKKAFGK